MKQEIINELIKILNENDLNYPISLVGSATTKDIFNDLDLLFIVDNIKEAKERIIECFENYNLNCVDDAIKIIDFAECEISLALYTKSDVELILNKFLSGKSIEITHRTWCIGYWLPESFVENLNNMIIINDEEDYLKTIQNLAKKRSVYARRNILTECLEEIKIKKELIKLSRIDSLEYGYLKNDLILTMIRGLFVIKDKYVISFKRVSKLIDECDNLHLIDFIKNNNLNSLDNIIKILENDLKDINSLYLGTWQFSGEFKKLTANEITELIKYAQDRGIKRFDTALVYGQGKVEKILSKVLNENDVIVTKIPGKKKPKLNDNTDLNNFYDYNYMEDCILESLHNLKRDCIDICLLHNWTSAWNKNDDIINWLIKLRNKGFVKRIGLSLPNEYNEELSDFVLKNIDVIEAPYNLQNKWIIKNLEKYKNYGIEVIVRSIFLQGSILKKNQKLNPTDIIKEAKKFNTSIVIGMTTKSQIAENTAIFKGD